MADDADDEMEIINPPNTLKSKVSTGGPGAVDMAALERAESVISGMTDNYLEWVQEDLIKIQAAYDQLASGEGDQKDNLATVFQVSHDIKGQGGSFGYDMMTALGNELCRLIEKLDKAGPSEVEAIKIHVDAMKLVIQNRMAGDGGKEGQAILSGIQKMCDKLLG